MSPSHTPPTDTKAPDSVGVVTPELLEFTEPLELECGKTLSTYSLCVETYGQLNPKASNAVLICHALSSDHHAAGFHSTADKKPGWWDALIGPNKAIDTNRFFVVCMNNLGGCSGSTGPTSTNPATNKPYGPDFPLVTVKDWVNSQQRLMQHFGLKRWFAVIGGSLGGMQALQWSIDYPELLERCVVIASTPKLSAQNIAFNEVARQSILTDPDFHDGRYLEHQTTPKRGLELARMIGHLTYLTEEGMKAKFGRDMKTDRLGFGYGVEFEVESYLRYQGAQFSGRFDANTYLIMTKALDYFDPSRDHDHSLTQALKHAAAKFLVVSFTTDWRFSPERSQELTQALIQTGKQVSYANIEAPQGHDAFLFPIKRYVELLKAFLEGQA